MPALKPFLSGIIVTRRENYVDNSWLWSRARAGLLGVALFTSNMAAQEQTQAERLLQFVRNRPVIEELIFSKPSRPPQEAPGYQEVMARFPNVKFVAPEIMRYFARWSPNGFMLREIPSVSAAHLPSTLKYQSFVGKADSTNWNASGPIVTVMIGQDQQESNSLTRHLDVALTNIIGTILDLGLAPMDPGTFTTSNNNIQARRHGLKLSGTLEVSGSSGILSAIEYSVEGQSGKYRSEFVYGNGVAVPSYFPTHLRRYFLRASQKEIIEDFTISSLKIADRPLTHAELLPDRLLNPNPNNYHGTILYTNNGRFRVAGGALYPVQNRYQKSNSSRTSILRIAYALTVLATLVLPILWVRTQNKKASQPTLGQHI